MTAVAIAVGRAVATLVAADVGTLVERLIATPYQTIVNPYHDNDEPTQEER